MTAKEYLSTVRRLDARRKSIEAELERLREEAAIISSPWPDGQPHGTDVADPTGSKGAALAEQSAELKAEYLILIERIRKERYKIILTIDRLQDPELNRLVNLRYVDGRSWEVIAVELGWSYRHTLRKHGEALQAVGRLIKK